MVRMIAVRWIYFSSVSIQRRWNEKFPIFARNSGRTYSASFAGLAFIINFLSIARCDPASGRLAG
jgi:hypothetical protein